MAYCSHHNRRICDECGVCLSEPHAATCSQRTVKTELKRVTNRELTPELWRHLCTRQQLRQIARARGIPRGRTDDDTARNITLAPLFWLQLTLEIL